ncbi:hypothetical protein, partial [Neisseria polysaccharea]|uniref:hypothetical protein n=1 Tax=Neisseria polysaccharea TaxID=489 RepID=UPI0027E03FF6
GGGGGGAEKAVTDIDEIKTLKIVLLWSDCFIKPPHFGNRDKYDVRINYIICFSHFTTLLKYS